ncbi:MAG TPA: hypothetical protein VJV79_01500 [Polyangiaceae bacterium]|nr:hypothetical protein [Polyangiaceae bacterium]
MPAKNPPPQPKHHEAQNAHPEVKRPQPKKGVPGPESSTRKATEKGAGQDPRNADDKDGNQRHPG